MADEASSSCKNSARLTARAASSGESNTIVSGTTMAIDRGVTWARPARPIALSSWARALSFLSWSLAVWSYPMSVPPMITAVAGRFSPWAIVPVAYIARAVSCSNATSLARCSSRSSALVWTATPLFNASRSLVSTPSSSSASSRYDSTVGPRVALMSPKPGVCSDARKLSCLLRGRNASTLSPRSPSRWTIAAVAGVQ